MRPITHLVAFSVLALALAGCGGDDSSPAPIDYGTGTGTLRVDASVQSEPAGGFQNPSTADRFTTEYEVRVRKMVGGVLTDLTGPEATVRFSVGGLTVDVPWDAVQGRYYVRQNGLVADVRVDLTVETQAGDALRSLARRAPGLHVFTNPTPGAQISLGALAGGPFTVTWSRAAAADLAELTFSLFDGVVGDTGSFSMANASFDHQDVPTTETCRLRRANSVLAAPGAALGGSMLETRIVQELDVQILP